MCHLHKQTNTLKCDGQTENRELIPVSQSAYAGNIKATILMCTNNNELNRHVCICRPKMLQQWFIKTLSKPNTDSQTMDIFHVFFLSKATCRSTQCYPTNVIEAKQILFISYYCTSKTLNFHSYYSP